MGHAAAAVLVSPIVWRIPRAKALIVTAAIAATLPDLDAIGRLFGRGDVAFLGGHRALTHSLLAAFVVGIAVMGAWRRYTSAGPELARVALYVMAAVGLHGMLDAFASYGDGIEYFAPFSSARFTAPWKPFTGVMPEMVALWLPALLLWAHMRRPGVLSGTPVVPHAP